MPPHKLHLLPRHLHMVQEILRQHLPNAHVWAYGSRVHGNHHDASDLDLVVRQPDNLSQAQTQLARVSEVFADSNLPLIIELVDWACIPSAFHREIEAGYVVVWEAPQD
jgi:predicted nucleotidyltransferase